MSYARAFRELVSGQSTTWRARALRRLLRLAEFPYAAATALRNRRYDHGSLAMHQVDVPVISVGNLTVGGTGKTPMVEWVTQLFLRHGRRVAIVSRGYGAQHNGQNDEAMELSWSLGDVPHVQDPDRVAAARAAIAQHAAEVLVVDDGFQHRRLARDFDLVMLDATAPFGYGHQLPRGLLRESPHNLRRADAVVLSRADLIDPQQRAAIRDQVACHGPHAIWCEVSHQPRLLLASDRTSCGVDLVVGKRIAAFCGIGNPEGFRATATNLAGGLIGWLELPDHCAYDAVGRQRLDAWAKRSGAELLLCTRKDLVKLQCATVGDIPVRAVAIELQFSAGQDELEGALTTQLRP